MARNKEQEIRDLEEGPPDRPFGEPAPTPKKTPTFTFGGAAQPPKIRRSSIWDNLVEAIEVEVETGGSVMTWFKWTLGSEAEARSAQQAVKQRLTAPKGQRYKTRVSGCELYVRLVPEGS